MERCVDFFNWLDHDTSLKILTYLEDPADLVRASAISRSWRHFVISNGLCKQLCLKMLPSLHRVDRVIEPNSSAKSPLEDGCSKSVEWETLEREHRAYAFLAKSCSSFPFRECISDAISASSTDNYPEESIHNTLEPRDIIEGRASYWSSKGQINPAVPETLVYRLVADICIITEISVQPFKAFFQWGLPIYSASSVRFKMGHPKAAMDDTMANPCDNCADDTFVWTYTSPEFAMAQENRLQKFTLPEPVLCIGGILQVELLGRVQRQDMDGLFYICVSHVEVMGRPLSPAFSVEILEPSGRFVLKAESYTQQSEAEKAYLEGLMRETAQLANFPWELGAVVFYDSNEEDELEEDMAL